MLEKDIENLIAKYPNEFFPKSGFKLIGQQVRLGNKYADIIFEDKYGRKIIIEVKRGILTREASGQVGEYYGLLKTKNEDDFIELILCANIIPPERKRFLEAIGIECKELGINQINKIAQKYNYTFINSETKKKQVSNKLPASNNIWIFQANPNRYNIITALSDDEIGVNMHWLVNQYKENIKEGHIGLIWLSGKEAGIYAITEIVSNPDFLEEPEAEKKYWVDEKDKQGKKFRVKMNIIKNLLAHPVMKENIINTTGLQNLSIIKNPRGTNFPVTPNEWHLIKKLVKENK